MANRAYAAQCPQCIEKARVLLVYFDLCARGLEQVRTQLFNLCRRQVVRIEAFMMILQDNDFLLGFRVSNNRLQEEAVELGFRQRIGSFKLDGILGGKDSKES